MKLSALIIRLKSGAIALCVLVSVVLPDAAVEAQSWRPGEGFRDRFTTGTGQGPEMVVLPPGSFTMGSPASEAGHRANEGPQRTVRIGYRLAVGRYEVTFAEWDACVADGGCNGHHPDDRGWGRGQRPVMNVSWYDVQAYVEWLNRRTGLTGSPYRYRLPSEAEWEYAVRAGTRTAFSFGDDEGLLSQYSWFDRNSNIGAGGQRTHPVGNKQPNAFGLHDMHGNVREWVEDCFADSYSAGQPSDGSAFTLRSCSHRVVRGGHFTDGRSNQGSARRYRNVPSFRVNFIGLRVARTLPD